MLYKFDLLFKKELKNGGVKVVTYRQLLQNPDIFGPGETLDSAVGTLSLADSERESGFSISSLFVKYRTQLVGYYWAEVFGKEFPLRFTFNLADDVSSIRAELCDENGFHYSSDVQTFRLDGTKILDLKGVDSFVALVPKTGDCIVHDDESEILLHAGQLVLIPAFVKEVSIQGNCQVKCIRCVRERSCIAASACSIEERL